MTARPRVLHVTTSDISLATLLGPQLRAFAAAGYDVVTASAPGPWTERLDSWGIEFHPLQHSTRSFAPGRDTRSLAELYGLFRTLRPDIVHTHNPKTGVYGRVAARAARVPAVVNTVHGLYALPADPWRKRAVVYGMERVAATCSDAELVQNPEDLDVLRRLRIPATRLRLLGNGIDLDRFDAARVPAERVAAVRAEIGAGPDDVVCGVVGRLVWEKGYREIFDAATLLASRAPNVRFVVVGPFEDEKSDAITHDDVARVARDTNTAFLGVREDVEDLYAAMDVFALASYREGFPRAAMEAAAMGVPVVASDVRGCRQVVEHGVTGCLFPVRDARALADAVAALAADGATRRRMGTAGREKARREFDQQNVVDITLDVYERLLARRRGTVHAA
ncbi:MAG TPA: glycosyltransferase family 4 protein [Acidimicrobiia bacterium]|nr:glycosyltransferase family 4 protein [Acidimicrobiia bacterium]